MTPRHVILVAAALLIMGPSDLTRAQACTAQQGQILIDQGRYKQAVKEFTCVIEAQPTDVEGYRGRIEAHLMLGGFPVGRTAERDVPSAGDVLRGRELRPES